MIALTVAKAPVAGIRAQRRPINSARKSLRVHAAVKFDYDTKVFKKELVKFADTEEYIIRYVGISILPFFLPCMCGCRRFRALHGFDSLHSSPQGV